MFGSPGLVSGLTFHQRTKPHRQAENGSAAVAPVTGKIATSARCAVEEAIGGLHQSCVGRLAIGATALGAEAVERSYFSRRGNFEDCAAAENQIAEMTDGAGTAHLRRSVEIPVAGPHQRGFRGISIGTLGLGTKAV